MNDYMQSVGIASLVVPPAVQVGAAVFVVSYAVLSYIHHLRSNVKTPPGPWGLPLLGHVSLLGKEPYRTFQNLRAAFGDIFQIRLGSWPTVVINGKKAIREALHTYKDAFSERPAFFSFSLGDGPGFTFGKFDETTILHRKMAAKVVASFSKPQNNQVADLMQKEIVTLIASFASKKGASFNPHNDVFQSVGSVIYQICFGRNESIREDPDFAELVLRSKKFDEFAGTGSVVNIFPWVRFFLPWMVAPLTDIFKKGIEHRSNMVAEHLKTFDANCLRDITDGFIAVAERDTSEAHVVGKKRIFNSIDDIVGAGFGTVGSTLEWMLLLMAARPEIQERVQQEIDDIVGSSRVPTMEDRGKLVYTEAVFQESMRFIALAPLAIPHCATTDTEFRGYLIKKGTVILINLYSMSHDPAVWGDPEVFRPDRFIDSSGLLKNKLLTEFLPFSTGRRRCLGEALAKMELFLFFTGIMQRCTILKPPEVEKYNLEAKVALIRIPTPYMVQVVTRVI